MEKITGNEPINFQLDWGIQGEKMTGLTIRQHFAAMAMQGLLSTYANSTPDPKHIAKNAVIQADALIAELNK